METGQYVRQFSDIGLKDAKLVGGKNAGLGELYSRMSSLCIPVPNGFAVTVESYWAFLEHSGLLKELEKTFGNIKKTRPQSFQKEALRIRTLIARAEFPENVRLEIERAYENLGKFYSDKNVDVAVRSSAVGEDSTANSFAGQQDTYLHMKGKEQVFSAIRKVFASLFNDRSLFYRLEKGLPITGNGIAVAVQKMVRSDIGSSGVMFTADPETGFRNAVVLQGVWGLGESIVQGKIVPDEFILFKPFLQQGKSALLSKTLGKKTSKTGYGEKGVVMVPVAKTMQGQFCISDEEAKILAGWGTAIENLFSKAYGAEYSFDIEWAKDGKTGEIFIVQARPETVNSYSAKRVHEEYILKSKSKALVMGVAVGMRIGAGKVCIARKLEECRNIRKGDVLVTYMTDPDWEPILRKVSAVVTESGGRTSHAAIIAREFGIPTVVGAESALTALRNGQSVTVDCSSGEKGIVYEGILPFTIQKHAMLDIPETRTKIMLNIGSPAEGFRYAYLPSRGVGLGRLEFIIASSIGIHPNALLDYAKLKRQKIKSSYLKNALKIIEENTAAYRAKEEFYIETLAKGIAKIAAAFWPHDVIIRFSDFKTNEYRSLAGGELYEPKEENPMLGWRGASRYYHPNFKAAFGMECKAIQKARKTYGFSNIIPMVPFCRTVEEAKKVISGMEEYGLSREDDQSLKVYVMCEIPSNVLLADRFLDIFDGMSIGSNDLTQLTLGLDRDAGGSAKIGNENNEAVKKMIQIAIKACKARGKYIGVCGQGPSDFPEFAEFLVEEGIDSISLNADAVLSMSVRVLALEEKRNISQEITSH